MIDENCFSIVSIASLNAGKVACLLILLRASSRSAKGAAEFSRMSFKLNTLNYFSSSTLTFIESLFDSSIACIWFNDCKRKLGPILLFFFAHSQLSFFFLSKSSELIEASLSKDDEDRGEFKS